MRERAESGHLGLDPVNCGQIIDTKIKIKISVAKLDYLILRANSDWLSYYEEPLTSYRRANFQIHWMRKFPNISVRPRGR